MEVAKLYKLNRGNGTEAMAFLIKGAAVNITVLGSQSKPVAKANMVDIGDGAVIAEGGYAFAAMPEYVYFDGAAVDAIEIINGSVKEDLGAF